MNITLPGFGMLGAMPLRQLRPRTDQPLAKPPARPRAVSPPTKSRRDLAAIAATVRSDEAEASAKAWDLAMQKARHPFSAVATRGQGSVARGWDRAIAKARSAGT